MPRRDDIEDIPMLKLDTDEIKAWLGSATQLAIGAVNRSGGGVTQREATIHPTPLVENISAAVAGALKRRFGLWPFWLLVIVMLASSSWWMNNRIVDIEEMLTISRGELGHARKRIGELEALVVATNVNANKSGGGTGSVKIIG